MAEGLDEQPCIACGMGAPPCDVPMLEGLLVAVAPGSGRGTPPSVTLDHVDGTAATVTLLPALRGLCTEIAALGASLPATLRARLYHLRRVGEGAFAMAEASLLVLEPDLLLNITDLNMAEYCVRQYPLRRLAPSPPTAATLRGTLIHTAFRAMLTRGERDPAAAVHGALAAQATDLALRDLPAAEVGRAALPHVEALLRWLAVRRPDLLAGATSVRAETFLLAPELGLKGRLDFLLAAEHGGTLLELKSGDVHAALPVRAHRWQVHGYQALLAARRPAPDARASATLLYSGTPGEAEAYGLAFTPRDLQHVLDLRNRLALVHATGAVPPPPGATRCARCAVRQTCARASGLLGWEPPPGDAVPVEAEDAAWYAHWHGLLRHEARAAEERLRILWRQSPQWRRAAGVALGDLVAEGEPRRTANGEWEYRFASVGTSDLREGDEVLVSDGDPVRGAMVSGTILSVEAEHITVWTPERIAAPTLLDRYASDLVHDRTVRNLWRWLDAPAEHQALVRGERAPMQATPDGAAAAACPPGFNPEQRAAVASALASRDVFLIQGPPGTGKTAVVAELLRQATLRGERVLVAAATNSAVDTVLRRAVAEGVEGIVRLGHRQSVAPDLRGLRLGARCEAAGGAADDPADLRATLAGARVVAATAATWSAERYDGVGELLGFDLAVVDEASQLPLPALLGALRFADRYVLVGDDRQLPPLVLSEAAVAGGLRRSLFAELLERWGDRASVALCRQYRMHPTICAFPSDVFYGGSLVTEGAARTALLALRVDPSQPLAPVLDPARSVVFVDVPPATEQERQTRASASQAEIAARLVLALRQGGVAAEQIGCVAPHRAQVAAIRQRLARHGEQAITVDTVERFQGAERDVLLCAFGTGQRDDLGATHFLADPHRLNVALTRARRKLILLGCAEEVAPYPVLRRLLQHCAGLYGGHGGVVHARRGAAVPLPTP